MKRALAVAAGVIVGVGGLVTVDARAGLGTGSCSTDVRAGGEWRSYGGSLAQQRNQTEEKTLNPRTVANVAKTWSIDVSKEGPTGVAGGTGSMSSTPVVADGCVYIATNNGFVLALNADTGERVWTSVRMAGASAGNLVGGVITGSPTVVGDKVYVGVSKKNAPFVAILDQKTGALLKEAPVLDPAKFKSDYNTTIVASPVVWNGVIFQGIMADENSAGARGGYAILDAATGDLLYQDWTISDAEYLADYRGASIWCTAAVDAEAGYAYACGGNPASKQKEARYANSLLKIDIDKTRSTFGQIVAAYKGNYDQYYPGLDRQPACDQVPTTLVWSPTCVQLDLDFGASPNLYTVNIGGKQVKLVGDLQKAGIYHAVFADNMQLAWNAVVGTPGPVYNAGSPAVDGNNVYTAASAPGQIWGLSNDRGRVRWVTPEPTGAPLWFESTSTANGVVYAIDNSANLHMLDAATGLPARVINLGADVGTPVASTSSHGVSIARNTVYAAAGSFVVAYR